MTDAERSLYERECEKHPWMKEVRMSDDEVRQTFDRDLGEGSTDKQFARLYRDHWSWVCLAVLKHFYETGEFVILNEDYLDGQNENVVMHIMKSRGADWDTVKDVICK